MSSWFESPFIAYDHSANSLKGKFSKSHILHVFNTQKLGYVPSSMSYQVIQKQLKSKFPPQSKQNSTIELRQQGAKSINDSILESFISSGMNLMFLGFYGSKDKKSRPNDFSSRIAKFVYESKISLAIIKRSHPHTDNILYCFDGSQVSLQGLRKANQFCVQYNKNLFVIHCTSPELKTQTKHIKNVIKNIKINEKNLKFEFGIQQADLLQWVKSVQNDYEWVIVTANGYRGQISKKRFVGHYTTRILEQTNVNLFLIR